MQDGDSCYQVISIRTDELVQEHALEMFPFHGLLSAKPKFKYQLNKIGSENLQEIFPIRIQADRVFDVYV